MGSSILGGDAGGSGVHELIVRYEQPIEPYRIHADPAPQWLDELELKPAPPHHRMGIHAMDMDDWFVIDGLRELELALRDRLLSECRDEVFAALPAAEPAAEETYRLVRDWLSARDLLHDAVGHADDHPLAAAGRLVQDDLCLMIRHEDGWRLDGAVVCFPSVWRLSEKLGHSAAHIHQPVDHYADELAAKVDRFFDRLEVRKPVWRRNLSLKPTHALYLPVSKRAAQAVKVDIAEDGAPYWMRSERQTLRKLPGTGAILFTIRTQLAPVSVLRERPDRAQDLVAMYRSWDDRMAQFKMADSDISANLMPWLERVAASA
jgi:dimethylamine monooxygenase subunit A